jgi:hypothetical protein
MSDSHGSDARDFFIMVAVLFLVYFVIDRVWPPVPGASHTQAARSVEQP